MATTAEIAPTSRIAEQRGERREQQAVAGQVDAAVPGVRPDLEAVRLEELGAERLGREIGARRRPDQVDGRQEDGGDHRGRLAYGGVRSRSLPPRGRAVRRRPRRASAGGTWPLRSGALAGAAALPRPCLVELAARRLPRLRVPRARGRRGLPDRRRPERRPAGEGRRRDQDRPREAQRAAAPPTRRSSPRSRSWSRSTAAPGSWSCSTRSPRGSCRGCRRFPTCPRSRSRSGSRTRSSCCSR